MNKTITVNISGIVFHIEEVAYEALQKYLNSIRSHFLTETDGEEIIADIEARIAEMFQENLASSKKEVLVSQDIDNIVEVMGLPEDFEAGVFEAEENENDSDSQSKSENQKKTQAKRLFRNEDEKVLGGVSSGLSAYLGIEDPLWIRLCFVLFSIITSGTWVLIYIVLWVIVPPAKTAADKLAMKGEPVNISNIEKVIKDGAEDLKDSFSKLNDGTANGQFSSFFKQLGNVLGQIAQFIVAFIGKFAKYIFGFVGGALVLLFAIIAFSMLFAGIASFGALDTYLFSATWQLVLMCIGLFMLVIIPLLVILMLILKSLFKLDIRNTGAISAALITLWFVSFFLCFSVGLKALSEFSRTQSSETEIILDQPNMGEMRIEVSNIDYVDNMRSFPFGAVQIDDAVFDHDGVFIEHVRLTMERSPDNQFHLIQKAQSCGGDKEEAALFASQIDHQFDQKGSILSFDPFFKIMEGNKWRKQELHYVLQVPTGKSVHLSKDATKIMSHTKNENDLSRWNMGNKTWTMLDEGLICLSCEMKSKKKKLSEKSKKGDKKQDYGYSRSIELVDFTQLDIDGSFDLEIEQSDNYSIELNGLEEVVEAIKTSLESNSLSVEAGRMKDSKRDNTYEAIETRLTIGMPLLDQLVFVGAGECKLKGFEDSAIGIDLQGAIQMTADIHPTSLNLELSGANNVELKGETDLLNIQISGTSQLEGESFPTKTCYVVASGTSEVELNVSDELTGQAKDIVKIRYKGDPDKVIIDTQGLAKISTLN